ncbi:uncharacterized protein [Populus alba]|uniref:uncharacterized protein n=1 Tax=Populus alba TaxID=43335 RepID=UPI003CC71CEA
MTEFLELRNSHNTPSPILYHLPHPWLSSKTDCTHPTAFQCTYKPFLHNTIQIGSLLVSPVTTGIRANNPRISIMPPETRATDLKRIEDSLAAVSQDHSQKYDLLIDMFKGQSLKLDQTIENQGGQIHDIRNMMGTMAQQLEFTLQKISQALGSSSSSRERPHLHPDRVDVRNKEIKEDKAATYKVHKPKHFFPTFNGGDVHKWLFKCTQYFEIEEVADDEKLQIASYYLDGVALYWHQNFLKSLGDQKTSWEDYVEAICYRFGERQDPLEELRELRQSGDLEEHIQDFDILWNKAEVNEKQVLVIFLGVIEKLKKGLFEPKTLKHAYNLTRLQVNTLTHRKSPSYIRKVASIYINPVVSNPPNYPIQTTKNAVNSHTNLSKPQPAPWTANPNNSNYSNPSRPTKFIKNQEFEDRRLKEEEEGSQEEEVISREVTPHISLDALEGTVGLNTMKVNGKMDKTTMCILIDSGSTHNFLNTTIVNKLQFQLTPIKPMTVQAANGDKMGISFQADVFIIDLSNYEMFMELEEDSKSHTPQFQGITDAILQGLLESYQDVFQKPKGLPTVRDHDHKIPLKSGSEAVNLRPYRYSGLQKDSLERMVTDMLETGIIRTSNNPFASPVILVKKKDSKWRLCVDYRALNQLTIKDKYPMIEELLEELVGATIFSKIDLKSGYHQIRMVAGEEFKTAFQTHSGHYEFLVMPFGLTNAPATFQSLMNEIFKQHLCKFILVFFDDILVYSRTLRDHYVHLEVVLDLLRAHQLVARATKCFFYHTQVEYLGHIITDHGVTTDPLKIQAIIEWPIPQSLKQLRGFLGLTGYYHRFVKGYGSISKPLTLLLRKDAKGWNEEASKAFNQLKALMTSAPVLPLPDFSKTFLVETDASLTGQHLWVVKLLGYDYDIEYKQGRENVSADALLRIPSQELFALTTSTISTNLMEEVRSSYKTDPVIQTILKDLQRSAESHPHYIWVHDHLNRKGKVVVGNNKALRSQIITMFHNSAIGGHSGMTWAKWLPLAEWWYNTNYHSATKMTPYEVLYGFPPPIHIPYFSKDSAVASVDEYLTTKEVLKKHVGNRVVQQSLPIMGQEPALQPRAILDRRMTRQNNQAVTQVLIHWDGQPPAVATWEFNEELKLRFPQFNLEDKVGFKGKQLL